MAVRIDETGKQALALKIDALRVGGNGLLHVRKISDRENFVAPDRDGFRIRILRITGKYLGVEKNALLSGALRPQRKRREKQQSSDQNNAVTSQDSSHGLALSINVVKIKAKNGSRNIHKDWG